METKHMIENVMKKFTGLDAEAKCFALGYIAGKLDEKQAAK